MSISIQMIDIVPSPSCNNDYLEIRENDGSGKVLGMYFRVQNLLLAILLDQYKNKIAFTSQKVYSAEPSNQHQSLPRVLFG